MSVKIHGLVTDPASQQILMHKIHVHHRPFISWHVCRSSHTCLSLYFWASRFGFCHLLASPQQSQPCIRAPKKIHAGMRPKLNLPLKKKKKQNQGNRGRRRKPQELNPKSWIAKHGSTSRKQKPAEARVGWEPAPVSPPVHTRTAQFGSLSLLSLSRQSYSEHGLMVAICPRFKQLQPSSI